MRGTGNSGLATGLSRSDPGTVESGDVALKAWLCTSNPLFLL